MELIDLGHFGSKFTWVRGRDPQQPPPPPPRTAAHLNRGLCNYCWRSKFADASIRHLAMNQSDHTSLLLSTNGFLQCNPRNRPFRFQDAWLMLIVKQMGICRLLWLIWPTMWNDETGMYLVISLEEEIVFGEELRGLSRALINLDKELRQELDVILDQIHVFWVQKARTDVLKDGDRNTKFFHACVVVRRKRNKIKGLFDDQGIWHDDPAELRRMVANHFKALFSEEPTRVGPIDAPRGQFPAISDKDFEQLGKEYSTDEVWLAMKGMGPLKRLGRMDSMTPRHPLIKGRSGPTVLVLGVEQGVDPLSPHPLLPSLGVDDAVNERLHHNGTGVRLPRPPKERLHGGLHGGGVRRLAHDAAVLEHDSTGPVRVRPTLRGDGAALVVHWLLDHQLAVLEDGLRVAEDEVDGSLDGAVTEEVTAPNRVERVLEAVELAVVEYREVSHHTHRHRLVLLRPSRVLEPDVSGHKPVSQDS
ncbi:hypothetical protein V2J09_023226 [Rumex salicifolius]